MYGYDVRETDLAKYPPEKASGPGTERNEMREGSTMASGNLQPPRSGKKIRVLVVDDQPAVREGLRMWLSLQPDLEIAGEAGDGLSAVSLAKELNPDVILMDARMPGMDGISATAALKEAAPEIPVIVLSLYDDVETRMRARSAGAAAFVAKHRMEQMLLNIVREVTCE